jgi:hypothetical protein
MIKRWFKAAASNLKTNQDEINELERHLYMQPAPTERPRHKMPISRFAKQVVERSLIKHLEARLNFPSKPAKLAHIIAKAWPDPSHGSSSKTMHDETHILER